MSTMIIIQEDMWRVECIAGFGINQDDNEIQLYPINSAEYVPYEYDNIDDLTKEYQRILSEWSRAMLGYK